MSEYIERRCTCCGNATLWPRYDATHKTVRSEPCRMQCIQQGACRRKAGVNAR